MPPDTLLEHARAAATTRAAATARRTTATCTATSCGEGDDDQGLMATIEELRVGCL